MTAALSVSAWSAIELLGDHLWHSTLVAIAVGLLTLVLRNNPAQVRHRLWLAASLKFLMPFGVLMAVGRQLGWQESAPTVTSNVMVVLETMSQPFSQPSSSTAGDSAVSMTAPGISILPVVLVSIWLCGLVAIVWRSLVQWQQMAEFVRHGFPVSEGCEVETLRRLERMSGITSPVQLVASDMSFEPGVFGILKPVLLWPRSMGEHLDNNQVAAILAHELSHVRRRDNLVAVVHLITQAVFWFHPLVWWVGARLLDERERSCDEDVIRLGSEPQVYAESILKTCRVFVGAPAAWVSGVTGSDLKRRIEAIMRHEAGRALNGWRKILLVSALITTIASPLVAGMLSAPQRDAQSPTAPKGSPAFEVVSVKQNKSREGFVQLGIQPGGRFTASNMPLRMLIRYAYQLQDSQLIGGPDWLGSDRFDLVAKAAGDFPPTSIGPARAGQLQLMLRALLTERFNLKMHRETRELPIYTMLVAHSDGKLGALLRPTAVDCAPGRRAPVSPPPGDRPQCGTRMIPGQITGGGLLTSEFAISLSQVVQRVVVDRTGLTGNFDIDLTWTPDQMPQGPGPSGAPPIDPNSPSIFTALQEQLGLKLDSTRGPVDVLVIDHVEPPTPD